MSDEYQLSEGIAVVGMAGRFPGAEDLDAYWANLREGVESISTFDRAELLAGGVDPDELDAPGYVPKAGAVEGVDLFDAAFFGFNPREAEILDPHHRLFLEHAWAALESAGYDPSRTAGAVGVYGGMSATAYLTRNLYPNREILAASGDLQLRIYTDKDFLASLAAYKLDLTGPSMTVQSACSTSLVAASLACQALTDYQCDMALAGGVCLSIPPKAGYFAHEGVFAPDGHCRAFDARAEGTVAGSGVGVVVLKRLEDALRDGDTVRSVIRGWGVNNDGGLKLGYTTPSQDGQAEVVAMAQAVAGVDASTVTYIETHGTGTPLGDQVEIAALADVFRDSTDRTGFCAVGSVKTNIGHLDAAAGVASLAKTVLALEHGELPPSLHFERPNPAIDFAASPFYVNDRLAPWSSDGPRRAGVSAFAVGGVNAHLVLEEAPAAGRRPRVGEGGQDDTGDGPHLLVLSARTSGALDAATGRLADALDDPGAPPLADVAHTLAVGRKAFEHRRAVVARDRAHAVELLRGGEPRRLLTGRAPGGRRSVAFLFPGLGNHSVGMARELYRTRPVFARWIDRAAEVLRETGDDLDLVGSLYPPESSEAAGSSAPDLKSLLGGGDGGATSQEAAGELLRTRLAQPALYAVEHALARLWISWGVEPDALMGYSIGEYVAATLAGVFRFEDAVTLVAERARRIDALPEGAMLAVPLSEDDTRALLAGPFAGLDVSAVNTPEVTVVAGPVEAIEALDARLSQRFGARSAHRRLATSHAFHSRQVEPVADDLRRLVASFELSPPRIPLVSDVTGTWMEASEATDPDYWARHLTAPVRAADGLARLLEGPENRVLLEVGPGQALSSWALQVSGAADVGESRLAVSSLPHAFDPRPDGEVILSTLGRLWLAGVEVDWTAFGKGASGDAGEDAHRRRVPLPTYPFERRRYWVDPPERSSGAAAPRSAAPESGRETGDSKRPNPADWLTVRVWRETAPVESPAAPAGPCLLVGWPAGLLPPLAGALEATGREVVLAAPADRFERLDEGAYLVDVTAAASWRELLADLAARKLSPELVVHALALGEEGTGDDGPLSAFWSLLALGKTLALGGEGDAPSRSLEIAVLGSGLARVADGEAVVPERSTLLGPAAVLPQEIPGVACRVLDVAAGAADPSVVAELLAADLANPAADGPGEPRLDDHLVAWRGRRRYLSEHRPIHPRPAPLAGTDGATPAGPRAAWRRRGTYLVTGGLGGIGLVMAEELARSLQARVALLARSPLPPRAEWEGIVAADGTGTGEDPRLRERLAKLLEIERLGAEVLVLRGDVTDRASLEAAVEEIHDRFGPVHGVLHAAGVYPGGMVMAKTREAASEVLAPKVDGTRNLDAVLGAEIELLVLFSSLTAELGGFGLVDHAAANAFLDAFAEARADEAPYRLVSVAWDTWLSVGQAAEAARRYHLAPKASGGELGDGDGTREPVRPVDHPLITVGLLEDGPERALYRTRLDPARHWVMDEHRLDGAGLLPGTGAVELLAAVARDRFGLTTAEGLGAPLALERMVLAVPITADPGATALLDLEVSGAPESGHLEITVVGRTPAGGRVEHLEAEARADVGRPDAPPFAEVAGRIATRRAVPAAAPGGGGEGREEGLFFGPRWRGLGKESGRGDGEALARFELAAEHRGDLERYLAHPALLDAATGFVQEATQGTFLPAAIERIALHRPLPSGVWSHVARLATAGSTVVADLVLYGAGDPAADAPVVAEITGFTLRRLDPDRPAAEDPGDIGGVAGAARAGEALAASVLEGIEPAEGAEVLRRLLAAPWLPPRVSVSTRPLPQVLAAARRTAGAALLGQLQELTGRAGGATHERPDLPNAYIAPRSELEADLERLWREVLGLDRVGVDDDFFDLGGDSLLATRMLGLLEERFGVRLGLAAVFEASTVARLAGAVVHAQAAQVDEGELARALGEIRDLDPETLKALLAAEAEEADQT